MKHRYTIRVDYYSGDSFGSYKHSVKLEMTWLDLDIAKENFYRIKDHYDWYESIHDFEMRGNELPEPEWHVGIKYDFCMKIVSDTGKELQFNAFWCDYFGGLTSVELLNESNDSILYIKVNEDY